MNPFKKLFAFLRLREAIRKADAEFIKTGRRQYVMPAANRSLLVLDRSNFRKLKMKHYISAEVKCSDLLRECFYHTPHKNGSGVIPEAVRRTKRAEFYRWFSCR